MRDDILERTRDEAEYIAENKCTVRACAKVFGVSKSTVHKDCAERLYEYDRFLFEKVRDVLNLNLSERHIRGGAATKRKYAGKVSPKS